MSGQLVLLDVFDPQFNWRCFSCGTGNWLILLGVRLLWAAGAFNRRLSRMWSWEGALGDGVGLFYSALDSVLAA
jgi:hypothetical protein